MVEGWQLSGDKSWRAKRGFVSCSVPVKEQYAQLVGKDWKTRRVLKLKAVRSDE